jgi:hypothetical protein
LSSRSFTPFDRTGADKVLKQLQKLTNDKLKLVSVIKNDRLIGYKVEIDIKGGANKNKNYEKGTALLSKLITEDKKTISISNINVGGNGISNGGNGNSLVIFNIKHLADGINGIVNEDGSTGRPVFFGLLHELVHGKNIMAGRSMEEGATIARDPDQNNDVVDKFPTEEIDVRKETNQIINEHIGEEHDGFKVVKRAEVTKVKQFGKEIKTH